MKKLDIMNSRKGEEWEIVDGKVGRVESEIKVEGPVVQSGIKEILIVPVEEELIKPTKTTKRKARK